MKKIELLVAGYNTRARRLYEKMGFKLVKRYLDTYPNRYLDENSKEYLAFKDEFLREGHILYNYVYKMELKREDFNLEI